MRKVSKNVYEAMERLSDREGVIGALAIDQRGSIKKMIGKYTESTTEKIEEFKCLVSSELTKYASSILLDPEYGLPASKVRDKEAGLLLAYEKTGYDATKKGRLPDILDEWSVRRLKEQGADFQHLNFPDHHHFSSEEIQQLQDKCILTTEKDYVRLQPHLQNLYYLPIAMQFLTPADEHTFGTVFENL